MHHCFYHLLRFISILLCWILTISNLSWLSCQDLTISGFIHLSPGEGLADRTVNSLHLDPDGSIYIKTPLAIQKLQHGRNTGLLKANSFDGAHHLIANRDFLFDIGNDNYISIIEKKEFKSIHVQCIDEMLEGDVFLIDAHKELAWVLVSNENDRFDVVKLSFEKDEIKPTQFGSFDFTGSIIEFGVNEQLGEIYLVDAQDDFYVVKSGEVVFQYDNCLGPSTFRDPQIFVDEERGAVYFSLSICTGIHRWDSEEGYSLFVEEGLIEFANRDSHNQILIGVTHKRIQHTDSILFIKGDEVSSSYSKILETNNLLIQLYSDNFSESLMSATYNGVYSFDLKPKGLDLFLHDSSVEMSDFGAIVRGFSESEDGDVLVIKESGNEVFELSSEGIQVREDLSIGDDLGTVWISYEEDHAAVSVLQFIHAGTSKYFEFDLKSNTRSEVVLPFVGDKFHIEDDEVYIVGRAGESGVIAHLNESREIDYLFEDRLAKRHVRASYFEDDRYLFGTHNGLLVWDRSVEGAEPIELFEGYSITYIRVFGDRIFVGTYNQGLYLLDQELNFIEHYDLSNSSSGNTVASMEQDDYGNYWVSTFGGMVVLDTALQMITRLTGSDGIGAEEFNRSASYKMNNGDLLFGSLNGFVRIDPAVFFKSNHFSEIELVDVVSVDGQFQHRHEVDNGYSQILGIPNKIQLKFGDDNFRGGKNDNVVDYLDFIVEPGARVELDDHGLLEISELHPGNYKVFVRKRLPNSPKEEIVSLKISRNYSRALRDVLIILGGLLAGSGIIYLVQRNRQRAREEKLILRNEINELRLKGLRAQLNPHFIFNALNSIQYFVQSNDKIQAREYLNKFSKLIRLILESSHFDEVTLSKEVEHIKLYLDLERMRFNDKWDYQIHVSEELIEDYKIPSMMVQPVVENAILHGVRHLRDRRGEILVNFELEDHQIKVVVEDNGVGMDGAKEIKQQKSGHVSLSTNITLSRLHYLNLEDSDKYKIGYHSKRDSAGKAIGTVVNLYMKTSNSYGAA